jgi:hypothetical protein
MDLQVKRKEGSLFTARDLLEVNFTSDIKDVISVTHSIELVEGVGVTHGGGAAPGEFLHHKQITDVNPNTKRIIYIDQPVTIPVEQSEKGTSTIKVVAHVVTQTEADRMEQARLDVKAKKQEGLYKVGKDIHDETILHTLEIRPERITSREIVLTWQDDVYL